MTYTLYNSDGFGSFAVEAALVMADADFTRIDIDAESGEHRNDQFAAMNPMKQIPTMKLPTGEIMTESAAIVTHLAHVFSDSDLAPKAGTPAHAQFLRWIVYMSVNLYEGDLRYFYSERYTTNQDEGSLQGVQSAAANHLEKSLTIIERTLQEDGPCLLGDTFSIADVYLTMVTSWVLETTDFSVFPHILELRQMVTDHPKIGPVIARHGL